MTDPALYRLNFHSQLLLPGPPFRGCGVASDANATDLATLGESTRNRFGATKGRLGRRKTLKQGWRAFKQVADSNGIPDVDDLVRIHRGMYPGLPDPEHLRTRDFGQVRDALDSGHAVSIALRLSALGATNPVDRTSADHQVVVYRRQGAYLAVGPFRPHSNRYIGHHVKLGPVEKAAKAIEKGLVLAWLYPLGGWTQARLATRASLDTVRQLRAATKALEARVGRKDDRLATLREDKARLRAKVAELTKTNPDDALIDELIAWLEERR